MTLIQSTEEYVNRLLIDNTIIIDLINLKQLKLSNKICSLWTTTVKDGGNYHDSKELHHPWASFLLRLAPRTQKTWFRPYFCILFKTPKTNFSVCRKPSLEKLCNERDNTWGASALQVGIRTPGGALHNPLRCGKNPLLLR